MYDRRNLELFIEAEAAGLCRRPANLYQLSASELADAADALRQQLRREKCIAARRFARKHPRLLAAAKRFEPQYRARRWPQPTIRNCLYHVCALQANDLWRANVRQLVRRRHVFNGQVTIALATGEGILAPYLVASEFRSWPGVRLLELPNDRELREVASFLPLLISVADPDERQATFYGHTKGNSTEGDVRGSIYWRNAAYHHLLDRADDCLEELETHAAVGIHKMIWPPELDPPYPSGLRHGHWMLAGTFFWFRHDRVFTHRRWRHVPADRYGAEAWLAGLFPPQEAASVFQLWDEWEYPTPNPYDPKLYPEPIEDEPCGS